MPATSESQQRAWMAQWRTAEIALARVRQAELATVDLARVAADLEDACVVSAQASRPALTSGLVEQQRAFHRKPRA